MSSVTSDTQSGRPPVLFLQKSLTVETACIHNVPLKLYTFPAFGQVVILTLSLVVAVVNVQVVPSQSAYLFSCQMKTHTVPVVGTIYLQRSDTVVGSVIVLSNTTVLGGVVEASGRAVPLLSTK